VEVVNGIPKTTSIVAGEREAHRHRSSVCIGAFIWIFVNTKLDFVLVLKLWELLLEVVTLEIVHQGGGAFNDDLMFVWDHAL